MKRILKTKRGKLALGIEEGLIAMLFWGISATLIIFCIRKMGWFLPLLIMRIIMILILSLFMAAKKKPFKIPAYDKVIFHIIMKRKVQPSENLVKMPVLIPIILIGIFDVLAFFFYNLGVLNYNAAVVISVSAISPAVTIILARVFFKERLIPNQALGIIGILTGLIMLSI